VETYKKIDDETLEITTTYVQQVKKRDLEQEKKMAVNEQKHSQSMIDKIDTKLNVLGEK